MYYGRDYGSWWVPEDIKCIGCRKCLNEDHDVYDNYDNYDDHDDHGQLIVYCNKCHPSQSDIEE
jgi:hypothetical protein